MDGKEFKDKLANIRESEPDKLDLEMLKSIKNETDTETTTYKQLRENIEYSGKISLRVPKSLHKELIEKAKQEGVSLNQYALYKLAK